MKTRFSVFFGFPEFLRIFEVSGKMFFLCIIQIAQIHVKCRCTLLVHVVGCEAEGTWFETDRKKEQL